jgi:hypothetical protein
VVVGEGEPLDVDRAIWSTDGKSITSRQPRRPRRAVRRAGGRREAAPVDRRQAQPRRLVALGRSLCVHDQRLDERGRGVHDERRRRCAEQVTRVFDYLTRDFKLGRQEAIQWKGADASTVEGIVTYPVDYQAGQKYPLAVMTHGGPQAADKAQHRINVVRNPGARG